MDDSIFRDFDAEMAEAAHLPVRFKLGGQVFTCVNPLPIGATVVFTRHALLLSDSQTAEPLEMAKQAARLANTLWSFVVPEQHEALDEAFSKVSDPTVLEKIIEYCITSATGRPTPGS